MAGFEPATFSLGGKHSIQAELQEQDEGRRIRTPVGKSHLILSQARLTAPAFPHEIMEKLQLKRLSEKDN